MGKTCSTLTIDVKSLHFSRKCENKRFLDDLVVEGKIIIIKEIQDYGLVVDRDQWWALVNTLLDLCWE